MFNLNKNINNYSIWQSWVLGREVIPSDCATLSYKQKIAFFDYNEKINHLQRCLNDRRYKPLTQIIYDIFSLTTLRNYILDRSLKQIAPLINTLTDKILQDPVVQKASLVERAITILNNKNDKSKIGEVAYKYFQNAEQSLSCISTDDTKVKDNTPIAELNGQVEDYLQNALKELQKNNNIPLPRWYHATDKLSSVVEIFNSEGIHNRGRCACASSVDEFRDYGDYAVALDHHNTWKNKVAFFDLKGSSWIEREMIWIHAGSQSIQTNSDTVAFIVTNQEDLKEAKAKLVEKNVMVVTRKFSEHLRIILELAENTQVICEERNFRGNQTVIKHTVRILPTHWINTWAGWEKYEENKINHGTIPKAS